MNATTIRAHFDGEQVVLDEPVELAPNTPLLVTVLTGEQVNAEVEDWTRLSLQALERAYGDDEPEYTKDMLKEVNPEYEGR
jgi:hypothetical protein